MRRTTWKQKKEEEAQILDELLSWRTTGCGWLDIRTMFGCFTMCAIFSLGTDFAGADIALVVYLHQCEHLQGKIRSIENIISTWVRVPFLFLDRQFFDGFWEGPLAGRHLYKTCRPSQPEHNSDVSHGQRVDGLDFSTVCYCWFR